MSLKSLVTIVIAGALLAGCGGSRTFDGVPLSSIEPGLTTESEVRELLGPPSRQVFNEDRGRNETIVYRTVERSSSGPAPALSGYSGSADTAVTEREMELLVHFDQDGIVTDHQIRRVSSRR